MRFKDFVTDIQAETEARFNAETEISLKRTVNDDIKTGLLIKTGREAAPVIPLDPLYEAHLKGAPIDEIMDAVGEMMRMTPPGLKEMIDLRHNIEEKLFLRVVDRSRNEEFLKDLVFYPGPGNYVLVPYIRVMDMMTRVTNSLAEDLGLSPGEIFDMAARNEAGDARLASFDHFGERISGNLLEDGELPNPMYILTNGTGLLGASQGFIKETLDRVMLRFGCGVYLLPSSIHEMIVIPFSLGRVSENGLREMVRSINDAVVKDEDVLSCDVLKYDGELKLADGGLS